MNAQEQYELMRTKEKLRMLSAELRSYKNWHEKFFDRINLKDPDLVTKIIEEMGQ